MFLADNGKQGNGIYVVSLLFQGRPTMKQFLVFTTCLLFPILAHAVQIDNPKVIMQARSGRGQELKITVTNPDPVPAAVRVYLEDFEYTAPYIGPKKFLPAGSSPRTIASMVSYEPDIFTVPAGGKQVVTVSILPREEIDTVRCGVLFFESGLLTTPGAAENTSVMAKLGALIFLEPHKQQRALAFTGAESKAKYTINTTVLNSGNTLAQPKVSFYVMNNDSVVVQRGVDKDRYLMPGDKAELSLVLEKDLPAGDYFMVINASMEEGGSGVHEIEFSLAGDGTATAANGN